MRKIYLVAVLIILCVIFVSLGRARKGDTGVIKADLTNQNPAAGNDAPGTIDGAKNPELIPDHVAYSAIFRMLSNRHTNDEIIRMRAYVKQMGLGKQTCQPCPPGFGTADSDVDALLNTAEEFYQRVQVIDNQVAEIKDRSWPNPSKEVLAQLRVLQQRKETIAVELAASLSARLTPEGLQVMRRHISAHVKQHVKLIPEPSTPPGGEGWQPQTMDHATHKQ